MAVSSLSAQLARLATPATSLLGANRKRASLLFDPRKAATLDAAAFYRIGQDGLGELIQIDEAAFAEFAATLFAESAARVQRAILSREENAKLDESIDKFCLRALPYFTLTATHKCLEWMLYRFAVNEYNVDALLRLALPHHDSNFATRLLAALVIPENSALWAWLRPLQATSAGLPRQTLLNRCLGDAEFLAFVCGLPGKAVEAGSPEVACAFFAATVVAAVAPALKEAHVATLMPFLTEGLKSHAAAHKLATLMVVTQLGLSATLAAPVVQNLVKLIVLKMRADTASEALTTILVLCQTQFVQELPRKSCLRLADKWEKLGLGPVLASLGDRTELATFLTPFLEGLVELSLETTEEEKPGTALKLVTELLLAKRRLSDECAKAALKILQSAHRRHKDDRAVFLEHYENVCRRFAKMYPGAYDDVCNVKRPLEEGKKKSKTFEAFVQLCDVPTMPEFAVPEEDEAADMDTTTNDSAGPEEDEKDDVKSEEPPKKRSKKAKKLASPDSLWLSEVSARLEAEYCSESAKRLTTLIPDFERVMKMSAAVEKRNYVLQLVLSSLLKVLRSDGGASVSVEKVRLELLIRCLRETRAPPTLDVLLSILSILARHHQERVLPQLMSVFTFWGTGLVKRDDAYSARLLASTLRSVIPSLMRGDCGSGIDQGRLVDVFRSFSLAVPDAPLHRRLPILRGLLDAAAVAAQPLPQDGEEVDASDRTEAWVLVTLLVDSHVARWQALKATAKKDALHPELEAVEELVGELAAGDQLRALVSVADYLSALNDGAGTTAAGLGVVDVAARSQKELWHLNYVLVGLLARVLGSKQMLVKLSDASAVPVRPSDWEAFLESGLRLRGVVAGRLAAAPSASSDATYWRALLKRTDEALQALSTLLPASVLLGVISGLLSRDSGAVRKSGLELLNAKLLQAPTPFTAAHVPELGAIADVLNAGLGRAVKRAHKGTLDEELGGEVQAVAYTLKLLGRVAGRFDQEPFAKSLEQVTALLSTSAGAGAVRGSLVLCLGELVGVLGSGALPLLPTFLPSLLHILKDHRAAESGGVLLVAALTAAQKMIEKLGSFLGPSLPALLATLAGVSAAVGAWPQGTPLAAHAPHRLLQIRKYAAALPTRTLLPAVETAYRELEEEKPELLGWVLGVLSDHVGDLKREALGPELQPLTDFFLGALELRAKHHKRGVADLNALEAPGLGCVSGLALKLSESALRPLLFRLAEWAAAGLGEGGAPRERVITFLRLGARLGGELKQLFLLFAGSFVKLATLVLARLAPSAEAPLYVLAKGAPEAGEAEKAAEAAVAALRVLETAAKWDSRGFFTPSRLEDLKPLLLAQMELYWLPDYASRVAGSLGPAVAALVAAVKEETATKTFNYDLLSKTHAKKHQIRQSALVVAGQMYAALGEDTTPLLPETVPFLAELLEDGNEAVEAECGRLVGILEDISGEKIQDVDSSGSEEYDIDMLRPYASGIRSRCYITIPELEALNLITATFKDCMSVAVAVGESPWNPVQRQGCWLKSEKEASRLLGQLTPSERTALNERAACAVLFPFSNPRVEFTSDSHTASLKSSSPIDSETANHCNCTCADPN